MRILLPRLCRARFLLPPLAAALAALALPGAALAEGFEGGGFGGFGGGGFGGEGFEGGEGGGFGSLAALALTVNMAYIPYKWLRTRIPELRIPQALTVHCFAGGAALFFGVLHALTAGSSNPLLWLGLAAMAYETVAGFVLRSRDVSGGVRRAASLLHAQRLVFYAMLFLLFVGHALAGE